MYVIFNLRISYGFPANRLIPLDQLDDSKTELKRKLRKAHFPSSPLSSLHSFFQVKQIGHTVIMFSPPKPGSKIIIVGGGCFGLSTAYALALKKKYEVVVYDRQPIPASDAASSGKKKGLSFAFPYISNADVKKRIDSF
jgi:hypothetical protein